MHHDLVKLLRPVARFLPVSHEVKFEMKVKDKLLKIYLLGLGLEPLHKLIFDQVFLGVRDSTPGHIIPLVKPQDFSLVVPACDKRDNLELWFTSVASSYKRHAESATGR
jgi:hypothetical protein